MSTWNDYKEYVRSVDADGAGLIEEAESTARIVGAAIESGSSSINLNTITRFTTLSTIRIILTSLRMKL